MWAHELPLILWCIVFFFIFVDDYVRYTHIYFLHKKCEALTYFSQYKSLVKDQTGKNILILCFDNGGNSFSINLINFVPIMGFNINLQIHTI